MKAEVMDLSSTAEGYIARGDRVAIRRIEARDLEQIKPFEFTVSITDALIEGNRLDTAFRSTGFWQPEAGAVAIVSARDGAFLGTSQFYRSAPCIHGYEMGYIIHDSANRGLGYASQAVRLFSNYLFIQMSGCYRLQLVIEVWNTASWRLAELCGFVREGLLRSSGFGSGDPSDCFIYARTRKDWHEELHTTIGMGGTGGGV